MSKYWEFTCNLCGMKIEPDDYDKQAYNVEEPDEKGNRPLESEPPAKADKHLCGTCVKTISNNHDEED